MNKWGWIAGGNDELSPCWENAAASVAGSPPTANHSNFSACSPNETSRLRPSGYRWRSKSKPPSSNSHGGGWLKFRTKPPTMNADVTNLFIPGNQRRRSSADSAGHYAMYGGAGADCIRRRIKPCLRMLQFTGYYCYSAEGRKETWYLRLLRLLLFLAVPYCGCIWLTLENYWTYDFYRQVFHDLLHAQIVSCTINSLRPLVCIVNWTIFYLNRQQTRDFHELIHRFDVNFSRHFHSRPKASNINWLVVAPVLLITAFVSVIRLSEFFIIQDYTQPWPAALTVYAALVVVPFLYAYQLVPLAYFAGTNRLVRNEVKMAQAIPQYVQGQMIDSYLVDKKLGEGGFGAVYKVSKGGQQFALKVEGVAEAIQVLKMEVSVLEKLTEKGRNRHFCRIDDKGRNQYINYVVMTFVGSSLQDLRKASPQQKLSMGCAISVSLQCLEALEDLHSIGFLHRDVKPGNFAVGRAEVGELHKVYVLDFGMCRSFVSPRTNQKRTPRAQCGFRGTVRYASINCHRGIELCEKDDLETWIYQMVELTKGVLPWKMVEDMNQVKDYKEKCRTEIGIKELCGGCPREFVEILKFVDAIKYYDTPNYAFLYQTLRKSMGTVGYHEGDPYDWEKPAGGATQQGAAPQPFGNPGHFARPAY